MKLYVGNLSFETTENDLQDLFEQHGKVSEVALMMDRMTGKSRGFAFVTMNDNAEAGAAMTALNEFDRAEPAPEAFWAGSPGRPSWTRKKRLSWKE